MTAPTTALPSNPSVLQEIESAQVKYNSDQRYFEMVPAVSLQKSPMPVTAAILCLDLVLAGSSGRTIQQENKELIQRAISNLTSQLSQLQEQRSVTTASVSNPVAAFGKLASFAVRSTRDVAARAGLEHTRESASDLLKGLEALKQGADALQVAQPAAPAVPVVNGGKAKVD